MHFIRSSWTLSKKYIIENPPNTCNSTPPPPLTPPLSPLPPFSRIFLAPSSPFVSSGRSSPKRPISPCVLSKFPPFFSASWRTACVLEFRLSWRSRSRIVTWLWVWYISSEGDHIEWFGGLFAELGGVEGGDFGLVGGGEFGGGGE